jgi:hypothetical protein
MNFITPLLFVFYLQVMPPPPPPTMHGGGDYWAGNTNTSINGNSTDLDWGYFDLLFGVFDFSFGRDAIGGYGGIEEVVDAIENGWMTDLTYLEWTIVLQFSVTTSEDLFIRACNEARSSDSNGETAANAYNCPVNASITDELLYIGFLSLIFISFFHYREVL